MQNGKSMVFGLV